MIPLLQQFSYMSKYRRDILTFFFVVLYFYFFI